MGQHARSGRVNDKCSRQVAAGQIIAGLIRDTVGAVQTDRIGAVLGERGQYDFEGLGAEVADARADRSMRNGRATPRHPVRESHGAPADRSCGRSPGLSASMKKTFSDSAMAPSTATAQPEGSERRGRGIE